MYNSTLGLSLRFLRFNPPAAAADKWVTTWKSNALQLRLLSARRENQGTGEQWLNCILGNVNSWSPSTPLLRLCSWASAATGMRISCRMFHPEGPFSAVGRLFNISSPTVTGQWRLRGRRRLIWSTCWCETNSRTSRTLLLLFFFKPVISDWPITDQYGIWKAVK